MTKKAKIEGVSLPSLPDCTVLNESILSKLHALLVLTNKMILFTNVLLFFEQKEIMFQLLLILNENLCFHILF